MPTINEPVALPTERPQPPPASGMRGWLSTLSQRDRLIYTLMLVMLGVIMSIYLVAGLRTLASRPLDPTSLPTSGPTITAVPIAELDQTATTLPATTNLPTPTDLPTSVPSRTPTTSPTREPFILLPTTPRDPTATAAPSRTPLPTRTSAPPTAVASTPVTASPTPTHNDANSAIVTLYFGDSTGTLFVPVERRVLVERQQIATAAMHALLEGPRGTLQDLLVPELKLLGLSLRNGTATVDFDRTPTGQADPRGLYAIVLTLTEFPSIQRVQFQVNGQNIGVEGTAAIARPVLNILNPENLPQTYQASAHLPLYFLSNDGRNDVRVIRLVQPTQQTAAATMQALLEGPGPYSYALRQVIPAGTALRGLRIERGIALVDFSRAFSGADSRTIAIRTVVESLTSLPEITGVQFLVEGRSLAEHWGADYGSIFQRPPINPE